MTKHMKTVVIPESKRQEVEYTTCDLCGERITEERFHIDTVTMTWRAGTSYPEGGSGEQEEYDMCSTCWRTKIVPWLNGQGANKPRRIEWDF